MERAAARFYRQALTRTTDASTRKLLGDLAEEEEKHDQIAAGLEEEILTATARDSEDENERRRFILQVIQPGLVGLMDGSVSTLAPVFAAAFATHNSWNAFRRRARGLGRRRHLDGLRRGAGGRRQAFGPRRAAAARRRLRPDDRRRAASATPCPS